MSLQANWNSAIRTLGIVGKIGGIEKKIGKKPYEKPYINIEKEVSPDIVASMRKQMSEEGTVPGTGTQEEKTFDKTVDELLDRKTGKSISAYKDYPEEARQMAIEENMAINTAAKEGISPKMAMLKRQLSNFDAAQRAQEHIQYADTTKNSGKYLLKFLKEDNSNG